MAKEGECPFYDDCGFVKWRKDRPFETIVPMPLNGDCGKDVNLCARVNHNIPAAIRLQYDSYGPHVQEEFDIALPANIPNSKGELTHRIIGGVDK